MKTANLRHSAPAAHAGRPEPCPLSGRAVISLGLAAWLGLTAPAQPPPGAPHPCTAAAGGFGASFSHPHVPWLTLPSSGFNASTSGSLAPYCRNPVAPLSSIDPDQPSSTFHANTTRHWPAPAGNPYGAPAPTFVIAVPPSVSVTNPPNPNLPFNLSSPISATFPGSFPSPASTAASSYTWNQWITAVQNTFAKFTSVPTANVNAISLGASNTRDYTLAAGTVANPPNLFSPATQSPTNVDCGSVSSSVLIWSATPVSGLAGPTGNGVNEVVLTDQVFFPPGGGPAPGSCAAGIGQATAFTSMLVDPGDGSILECDIILNLASLFILLSSGPPVAMTVPEELSLLTHEVGHFFGLDHTNLHPGPAPFGIASNGATIVGISNTSGTVNCVAVGQPSDVSTLGASLANFPANPIFQGTVLVPGMTNTVFHLGSGFDHTQTPLHPDDAAGLSMTYPFLSSNAGQLPGSPSRVPLINTTARLIGRHSTLGNALYGRFDRNIWVTFEGLTDAAAAAPGPAIGPVPIVGTISGLSRLTATDEPILSDPGIYTRPAGHPLPQIDHSGILNANLNAAPSYFREPIFNGNAPASRVGADFTLNGAPAPSTGDFSIDGIPIPSGATSTAYEVIIEPGFLLGATGIDYGGSVDQRGTLGEWWWSIPGVYTTNPVTPAPDLLRPYELASNPPVPGLVPNLIVNFLGSLYGPQASGLRMTQGTVIALDPMEHLELALADQSSTTVTLTKPPLVLPNGFPAPNPPLPSVNQCLFGRRYDLYSRPLVSITPRTTPLSALAGGSLTVTATPTRAPQPPPSLLAFALDIDVATARVFLNGTEATTALSDPSVTLAVNPTTGAATWTIPLATLLAVPHPASSLGTPVRVQFLVKETDPDPATAPLMTPILAFGRNDLVLF